MLHLRSSSLVLLLILQWAAGLESSPNKVDVRCDFVCDWTGCLDEQDCGYRGADAFQCDFEDEGMCGWTARSMDGAYYWERRQGVDTLPNSGPASDFTTGTATGWYMGVSAVKSDVSAAFLMSPYMQQSSPTCRLRLRYFMWDSGHTGLGFAPLWAIFHSESQSVIAWRPEPTTVRGWREATIFLGHISSKFKIHIYSLRSVGKMGDLAIDQMEFLDCALPLPLNGKECPADMVQCNRGGCVELWQRCDGSNDCGDGTDEEDCEGYQRCDFEEGLCNWNLSSLSALKWERKNQANISLLEPLKGPGRDHSNNSIAGYFLYVTVPANGVLKDDWAAFQSPSLKPTNSSHPCRMVMYTHQFGPRSGGLSVLVANRKIQPVWERGGALGDVWVKAEVEIVSEDPFQILIVAAIRDAAYGGIAIDSIVLSPQCRLSKEISSATKFPDPPKHPCTEPNKMCNFYTDCAGGEDEAKCGDFSYFEGSSGWTDASIGSQSWVLYKNTTTEEEYLYVAQAPGQYLTNAQTQTPLLGPSGPACTLSFDYALTGRPDHIGDLSVRVIDSLQGMQPKLWEFGGKTGTAADGWKHAELSVGAWNRRFQLAFEARAKTLCPSVKIRVRNVEFINCNAGYYPFSPTGLSCNFENGLCGWYQDNGDNFDWMVTNGMDHTIGIGRSLAVNMWSSSVRGVYGRLISYQQPPGSTEYCLSFFFKLYGPNTGTLNVKLLDNSGYEELLWTRSGAHGNVWHEAHCPVPHQLTNFRLMFEAVRSGFDGQVAIDDVAFIPNSCSVPRMCSFEGQRCGYRSSGKVFWLHLNGRTAVTAGPETDHTLETGLGFYMMVNTGGDILPSGSTSVLTSPIRRGIAWTECVNFWYHMGGGANPGSLTVYMKPVKGERVKIFSDNVNQGDMWRHGNGNISSGLVDWQLEFEVVGAGGKDTHVAVDDIFLSAHACENPVSASKCSMERGMCSWSNTQNKRVDKLDWELTSHEAEKHYSVPTEDHTLGTEKGHFLFFPSSNRTIANDNAQLLSPHLPPTKGTCLKFWAYKPYSSNGRLFVWSLSGGNLKQLVDVSELEGLWKRFDVDIMSAEEYQIVFEGTKGSSGFVALDDIEYTVGINCANEPTDVLITTKRDTSGVIAASVIVVLLLIGTLVALLYFYLKIRERLKAANGRSPPSPSPSAPSVRAGGGFNNEIYEGNNTQDHVNIPNHPMEAGFNNPLNVQDQEAAA